MRASTVGNARNDRRGHCETRQGRQIALYRHADVATVYPMTAFLQAGLSGQVPAPPEKQFLITLQLRHRPTFLYDYLQPALETGLVEMTQPASPKSPTQRYRLTKKGRARLTS